MKYLYKITLIFLIHFPLISQNTYGDTKDFNNSVLKINPDKELKKGNLLIGIKQHLGDDKKKNSNIKTLLFESDKDFLYLTSSNGILHKSKQIKISLMKVSLPKKRIIERYSLGPFASFESAKRKSNLLKKAGLDPLIVFPDKWELWMPINNRLAEKYKFKSKKIIYKSEVVPFLNSEFLSQKLEGIISISSKEDIQINNITYGKNFYLIKDSYGTWSLIQRLSFNKYLEGVLPHEIGANAPLESLKAQAVIARTWALYNSDRFKNDYYHLCVTTQCQVYKPSLKLKNNIKKAIDYTSGLILTYENKPINAFYHASNGGIMASSGESWQMIDYPYFQPKLDLISSPNQKIILPFKNRDYIKRFFQNQKIKFLGRNHYLFRWEKQISAEKINKVLIRNKRFLSRQKISDIRILERGISGRVTKLEITTEKNVKPIVFIKDDIRRYLSFLPSNLFVIDKLNDNFWIFNGGGFGHGVGLSQSGAIEMANLGFDYADILSHYYSGTKIEKVKELAK